MDDRTVSMQTLRRLPVYLHFLHSIKNKTENVSATTVADAFGLGSVQVRKDLGAVSGSGRPKTGYNVNELISQIEAFLGCACETKTVLIGAGNLGKALLSYNGFRDYGLELIAAFDESPDIIGTKVCGKPVYAMEELSRICAENHILLAIITVPVSSAQHVCDELCSLGIRAIWNFAPTILRAPKNVLVENENLASSLAVLSKHLRKNEGGNA